MANYTPTNLEDALVQWRGDMAKAMNRTQFKEFIAKMAEAGDYIIPEAEAIRQSTKRTVKANILKTVIDTSANTGRTCTIGGSHGDSVQQTLSWLTCGTSAKISMKMLHDNVFTFEQAVSKRMTDMRQSCLRKMNNDASSFFAANISTVNNATSYGTFDGATNTFEIDPSLAANPGFMNIVEQMLKENRYMDGPYEALVNGYTWPQIRYQSQQGSGNDANLAFQFGDFNITNGLSYNDANYPNWHAFVYMTGLVGSLFWTSADYRNPMDGQSLDGDIGVKTIVPDPEIPGLTWMLKTQLRCEDNTSNNGGDDDEEIRMHLSADYSFNFAPTEDSSTPIFKVASEEQAA